MIQNALRSPLRLSHLETVEGVPALPCAATSDRESRVRLWLMGRRRELLSPPDSSCWEDEGLLSIDLEAKMIR